MKVEQLDAGASFRQLKESIGSLMFCWCRLEETLAQTLRLAADDRHQKASDTFNKRVVKLEACLKTRVVGNEALASEISTLMARIDGVRRQRNLIVHGLAGVCADPAKGPPHLTCIGTEHRRRASVKITQADLTALLASIEQCWLDMDRIEFRTRPAMTKARRAGG